MKLAAKILTIVYHVKCEAYFTSQDISGKFDA